MNALRANPVRLYAIAVSVLAVVAHYLPSIPTGLYLAVVAAVLGLAEGVRSSVTPNSRVVVNASEVPDGGNVIVYGPDEFRG